MEAACARAAVARTKLIDRKVFITPVSLLLKTSTRKTMNNAMCEIVIQLEFNFVVLNVLITTMVIP